MVLFSGPRFGSIFIAIQAPSTTAAPPPYLSGAEIVSGLADGQPWTIANSDGRSGRIRFNANGTGAIESPVKRRIRWTIGGNTFCMRMGFMLGTRCFQATRSSNGFQGYNKGRATVRFTR
jgi:hypothetical protein